VVNNVSLQAAPTTYVRKEIAQGRTRQETREKYQRDQTVESHPYRRTKEEKEEKKKKAR
jgi:hypothetical protein